MKYETESIEYKLKFTEEIYKEVIAFANTNGGEVFVGIDNDGNVVGLSDVDGECSRIANGVRDAIAPDVTMFVHFTIRDDKVVRIAVSEGTNKPYYLKGKGIKPSGVYVRQGGSSAQASPEQIRRMIKESDGDVFEEMRSLCQDLTFNVAAKVFKRYKVEFSPEKYLALGVKDRKDDMFTNLGALLSDQCAHTTKVAVFTDEECTSFRDSKEFGGSVLNQFDKTIEYLSLCNKTAAVIKGVERIEKSDYPEEAIREALLNALIHRDYSYSGSIIINVNDAKMEFITLGGLLPGLELEDIRAGISQLRNKALAEIFHRLRLIESYGTGIRRIFKLYENCPVKPKLETTPNTFKIVLPNMNAVEAEEPKGNNEDIETAETTPQMDKILKEIEVKGKVSVKEICDLLGVKKTRGYVIVRKMCEMGMILPVGQRGKIVYVKK